MSSENHNIDARGNKKQDEVILFTNGKKHHKNGSTACVMTPLTTINNGNNKDSDCVPDDDIDDEIKCGLGPCTPKWMNVFASKQAFLVTFCLTWVLQGMFSTYFVSLITTIEKLFRLQSKMTGMIMSAIEIGQIASTFLFTYYGGHGHRPRWIAFGILLFAIASFTCSLPHFIFNNQLPLTAQDNSNNNNNYNNTSHNNNVLLSSNLCFNMNNMTKQDSCKSSNDDNSMIANQILSDSNQLSILAIFIISLLAVGMGQAPVYALGISYIDDNIASKESPLYFAITIGVRILGPALGYLLGSFCMSIYVDLSQPKFGKTDPRWVGAWWLGLILVSAFLMLASLAMFSFPRRLKTYRAITTPAVRGKVSKHPSIKDFPKTIKRLVKNDMLMLRTASTVLHLLPIAGLYTFLPKFFESQFRFAASEAAFTAAVGGILVMGLGIILSGIFILRVKPNPRFVAGWITTAAFLYSAGMAILMFVGCPMDDFRDIRYSTDSGKATLESICANSCGCNNKFNPVCGEDQFTYLSACYAGCSNSDFINGTTFYTDCKCLSNNFTSIKSIGYCDWKCDNFTLYIVIFSIFVFIHSTSEVGSMLLTLRCVDPRDKTMALGVIQFAISLLGNVPCSVIYGAVVDSACLVWDTICGKNGACSLYDSKKFSKYFHGTTSGIMLCAFLVDLIVLYKADNINFGTEEQLPTSAAQQEELTPITERANTDTGVST